MVAKKKAKKVGRRLKKKASKKKGLTAKYLLKMTPSYVRNRGGSVALVSAKKSKKYNIWKTITRTNILGEKPRKHMQEITLLSGESVSKSGKIKVSCDCGFFLYVCEVALYLQGAADIIYSNGELPKTTNPKKVPLVCKHLHTVLKRIISSKK